MCPGVSPADTRAHATHGLRPTGDKTERRSPLTHASLGQPHALGTCTTWGGGAQSRVMASSPLAPLWFWFLGAKSLNEGLSQTDGPGKRSWRG